MGFPVLAGCSALLVGCTVEPSSRTPTDTSNSTTVAMTLSTSDDTSSDVTSGSGNTAADATTQGSGEATSGAKLDAGTDADTGCDAIDLLFVIDNSASMNTYQMALSAAFPSFIDALWESLPSNTSVHVGITTTDFGSPGCANAMESTVSCQSTASASDITMHYDTPANAPSKINGAQGRLFEWAGLTYFEASTADDNEEIKTWFAGAATAAGENGCTYEMPVAAAGWAFAPPNVGEVLSTNEGFLRNEGTVLVLFFLTDEPDKSPEGVSMHRDRLLAAKAGCGGAEPDDLCVVTAGFIPSCTIDVNQKLWQFMTSFGEAPEDILWGDITDIPSYDELVGDVLAGTVTQTCAEVPPVG
jgi:hypothetical protein